jgi:hypothetical protein
MSQLGIPFADAPQSDVVASAGAVGRAVAPRTNSGMQLAAALQDLNPDIRRLGASVVAEDKQVQSEAAKKRALELGGKSLADAVRSGEIAPTQNPFFIEDYNKESAYVRAQSATSALALDSQSWAERSDPAKFQQRYSKELAGIGEHFSQDDDTMAGFNAAAAPAQQQAFAANTAAVSAEIVKTRDANMSQLINENLTGTQNQHAGHASPQQLEESLGALKDHYIGTGGTETAWAQLVYHGYTSAAYNTNDADLLDKIPGNIKNLPGIADQISTDKYHILQSKGTALRLQAEDFRAAITLQGQQIFTDAYKKYGTGLMTGQVSLSQLEADNPGANPLALASALNTAQAATADNQSLAIAKTRALEQTPNGAAYILDLHQEASTQGITPEFIDKVGALVISQQIPLNDATQLIDKSIETTNKINNTSGPFGSQKAGMKVASAAAQRRMQPYADLRRSTDAEATTMVNWVNKSARIAGNAPVPTAALKDLQARMSAAAAHWLAGHPGDFAGARKAAQQENGNWFASEAEKYTTPKKAAK